MSSRVIAPPSSSIGRKEASVPLVGARSRNLVRGLPRLDMGGEEGNVNGPALRVERQSLGHLRASPDGGWQVQVSSRGCQIERVLKIPEVAIA
jgi:hypothetical protein